MSSFGSCEAIDGFITLRVIAQDSKTAQLMGIKLDCQMHKLMNLYCEKRKLDHNTLQFLYGDGLRIQKRDTPRKLGLSNGDEILILMHQNGGGFK